MFDPAVLGTTIIGLEAIRRETSQGEGDRSPTATARPTLAGRGTERMRRFLATMLRRAAEVIGPEPRPTG